MKRLPWLVAVGLVLAVSVLPGCQTCSLCQRNSTPKDDPQVRAAEPDSGTMMAAANKPCLFG
jgi:hypothetical protein